jgi:glutaredoxin
VLIRWERRQGRTNLATSDAHERFVNHVFRNIFAMSGLEVRRALLSFAQSFLPADRIDRPVVYQGEEERAERAARGVVGLWGAPEGHERVMDDVLGQDLLAGEPVGKPVCRRSVPAVELVERTSISRGEAPVKLQILAARLTHAPGSTRAAGGTIPRMHVVLYAREGCHLCEAARAVIEAERARTGFAFDEVDIETADDLVKEYGIRIPVVTVDGEERFEIEVDPAAFASAVRG